jgi:hypothetical protein
MFHVWRAAPCFANPFNDLRPVEYEMSPEIENWHGVWAAAANFLAHPRNIGMQTASDLFN